MSDKLRDPVNVIGILLVTAGAVGVFSIFYSVPDSIPVIGFILYLAGIIILIIRNRHREP